MGHLGRFTKTPYLVLFIILGAVGVGAVSAAGLITFSSTLDMDNNPIINLQDPTNPQDAVSKAYVDSLFSCDGAGQSCTAGIGECENFGVNVCMMGTAQCSVTAGTPSAELCDGLDNDCDGLIDEDPQCTPTLTVTGSGLTVNQILGTTTLNMAINDVYGFTFVVQNPSYTEITDLFDPVCEVNQALCLKLTKVNGSFDITFNGANAAELNSESSNWTHGLIQGDGLMSVTDVGSGNFETFIFLLPDDIEQYVYWEMKFTHAGGYSLDVDGFPIIADTNLSGALAKFFDFRGANAANIFAQNGNVNIDVSPDP